MQYCPYCSATVSDDAKSCHNCKKILDLDTIKKLYNDDESQYNKSVIRAIWLKEHMRFVWPVVAIIIGFIAGGIILYGYAKLEFSAEREEQNDKISNLEKQIVELNSNAKSAASGLQGEVAEKDAIIAILVKERETLSRIINWTRRFSGSSIITAKVADSTSFNNNFRFLQKQFSTQQEQLSATSFKDDASFNLKTVPQFLQE